MYSFRQPFPAPKAKGTTKKGRKAAETVTVEPTVEVEEIKAEDVSEAVESDTINQED